MIGESGRIVIEIDPDTKKALHDAVSKEGLTLKEWFLGQADTFLRNREQISIDFSSSTEEPADSGAS